MAAPTLETARKMILHVFGKEREGLILDGLDVLQVYDGHREALRQLYSRLPGRQDRIPKIDYILQKYRGREDELWLRLEHQYRDAVLPANLTVGHFRPQKFTSGSALLAAVINDLYFVCPLRNIAAALQGSGQLIYVYLVNGTSAIHGAELPRLFSKASRDGQMLHYWTRFEPLEPIEPTEPTERMAHGGFQQRNEEWQLYDGITEKVFAFQDSRRLRVVAPSDPENNHCQELWMKIYPEGIPLAKIDEFTEEPFHARLRNSLGVRLWLWFWWSPIFLSLVVGGLPLLLIFEHRIGIGKRLLLCGTAVIRAIRQKAATKRSRPARSYGRSSRHFNSGHGFANSGRSAIK